MGALTFDPIRFGLAVSHNRPDAILPMSSQPLTACPCRLGCFSSFLPHASKLGVLMNPEAQLAPLVLREIESTLRGISIQITHSAVRKSTDLRVAFGTLESERIDGVVDQLRPAEQTCQCCKLISGRRPLQDSPMARRKPMRPGPMRQTHHDRAPPGGLIGLRCPQARLFFATFVEGI